MLSPPCPALLAIGFLGLSSLTPLCASTIYADRFEFTGCLPDEFEPNDSIEQAAALAPGNYSHLTLCSDDPSDYFFFGALSAGATITVTLTFSNTESDLDLYLRSTTGSLLDSSASLGNTEEVSYANDTSQAVDLIIEADRFSTAGSGYSLDIVVD